MKNKIVVLLRLLRMCLPKTQNYQTFLRDNQIKKQTVFKNVRVCIKNYFCSSFT